MNYSMRPNYLSKGQSKFKEFWNAIKYFLAVEAFITFMMLGFGFGGKLVIQLFIGVPPLLILASSGKKAKLFILYYLCLIFVIGQRTIWIGHDFRIVPSAAIFWGLALMLLLSGKSQFRTPGKMFPASVLILSIASAFAIALAVFNFGSDYLNLGFGYAHMMWMSIPAFYVCNRLVQRIESVQNISTILSFGCIFLSFLGIAEYLGMGFVHYFSGFIKGETMMGQEGTTRMAATFWGNSHLASYLAMCFPLIMVQVFSSKTMVQKALSMLSLVLTFTAIYLSGHRGVWIPVLLGIAVYFYFKGAKGVLILFILIALGVHFVPESAKARMAGLSGEKRDSSSVKREHRALDCWELIKKSPILGHGWGASGLVHSDPLQIWADAGLAGFLGFVGSFLAVWRRLFRVRKIRDALYKEYFQGFFVSAFISFGILVQQSWMNLPEDYTPFWIIMGLAYQFPNVVFVEKTLVAQQNPPAGPVIYGRSQ